MGFLSRLFEFRASPENPSTNLSNPADWLVDWASGLPTKAGVHINESNALRIAAVWACVRVLAESVASLPLILYRRNGRNKDRATEHPLYRLMHDQPNEFITSFVFREVLMGHVLTWGNCYAELTPPDRRPIDIVPLRPDWTEPMVGKNGRLVYWFYPEGDRTKRRRIMPENIIHVPGLGFDGVRGHSVIGMHRETLGLSQGALEYGSAWFGNGSRPSGVLQHPGRLTQDAARRIKNQWDQMHQGPANAHKTAVLEEGLTWQQIGLPPEDSQFLETRRFQVEDISRIYRVPPHMIQDLSRATFSNIEHQGIDFVTHSLRPWLVRWEQELNRKLLSAREQETHFFEFLVDGLLRGDLKSRFEGYAIARQWGWMNADEIRAKENQNPMPDGQGEAYLVPLNMRPADEPLDLQSTSPADERSAAIESRALFLRRRVQQSFRRLVRDAAERVVRRENKATRDAIKRLLKTRAASDFKEWAETFFRDHAAFVSRAMLPVFLSFAEEMAAVAASEVSGDPVDLTDFVRRYVDSFALRHTESKLGQLLQLIDETDAEELGDILEARVGEWGEKTADKIADRETVQAGAAFAKAVWVALGVTVLRWITVGENCPLCNELSGKVVAVDRNFVNKGDVVGSGTDKPLHSKQRYGHPPLHRGCDCMVAPG